MPLYEFKCDKCNHHFEELFMEATNVKECDCPKCKSSRSSKRMISKSSFRTKSDTIKGLSKHRSS
jgi:putative FmdB family regulatory protein